MKLIKTHNNIIDTIQSSSIGLTIIIAFLASLLQIEWIGYVAITTALPCLLIIIFSFKSILKFKKNK